MQAEDDVEDVPHPEDREEGGEDEPFTEEEVEQMLLEVKDALLEAYPGEEGEQQVQELEEELGKTQVRLGNCACVWGQRWPGGRSRWWGV